MKNLLRGRVATMATMALTLPLLAFGPQERTDLTHWALVVGISDYINFDDVEGGDLPGAEHDARLPGLERAILAELDQPVEAGGERGLEQVLGLDGVPAQPDGEAVEVLEHSGDEGLEALMAGPVGEHGAPGVHQTDTP